MLHVERAALSDMAGAYRVCLLTGDAGGDATTLYPDPDLPGHVYVGPYLVRDAGTQLVVVDEQGVAGYLLSTDDTAAFEAWAEAHWWPLLRARYPLTEDDMPAARLIRRIHEPQIPAADVLERYPAHFHIDLLERTRGSGQGRTLVERLFDELRTRGVPGVHMGVAKRNTNALGFYGHLGFEVLEEGTGSVLMGMTLG